MTCSVSQRLAASTQLCTCWPFTHNTRCRAELWCRLLSNKLLGFSKLVGVQHVLSVCLARPTSLRRGLTGSEVENRAKTVLRTVADPFRRAQSFQETQTALPKPTHRARRNTSVIVVYSAREAQFIFPLDWCLGPLMAGLYRSPVHLITYAFVPFLNGPVHMQVHRL